MTRRAQKNPLVSFSVRRVLVAFHSATMCADCFESAVARHMNVARDGVFLRFLALTPEAMLAIKDLAGSYGGYPLPVAAPGQYLADAAAIREAQGPLREPLLNVLAGSLPSKLKSGALAESDAAGLSRLIEEQRAKGARRTKGRAKQ